MCSRGWSKPDPNAAILFDDAQHGYSSWQPVTNHTQNQDFPRLTSNMHSPTLQPTYKLQSIQAHPLLAPGFQNFQHVAHVQHQNRNIMEVQHPAVQSYVPAGANSSIISGGDRIAVDQTFNNQGLYHSPGTLSLNRSRTTGEAENTLRIRPGMHQDLRGPSGDYRQTASDNHEFMVAHNQGSQSFQQQLYASHGFGGSGSEHLESKATVYPLSQLLPHALCSLSVSRLAL